jgi:hypothetical protein
MSHDIVVSSVAGHRGHPTAKVTDVVWDLGVGTTHHIERQPSAGPEYQKLAAKSAWRRRLYRSPFG